MQKNIIYFQIGNAQIGSVEITVAWTAFILPVHDRLSENLSPFYTFYIMTHFIGHRLKTSYLYYAFAKWL